MLTNEAVFARAVEFLRNATRVVVFTGAGVSAESGIPTFRDPVTGMWEKYGPAELATAAAFRKDPALVWGWYEWRRALVAKAQPNEGHHVIAALERFVPELLVVTQNVDDLHERAGSLRVVHLHGSLQTARCFACARPYPLPWGHQAELSAGSKEPPRCLRCNGRVRPGVVWFGEKLPQQELNRAIQAAKESDLFLSLGTSGVVYPAAQIPEVARQHGATVLHFNTEAFEPPDDHVLVGRAGYNLVRLLSAAFGDPAPV